MARIEQAFVEYLSGEVALVGERIYPLRLPQNPALPAIVYQRISRPEDGMAHDGAGSGIAHPRFQFACYANEGDGGYDEAQRVAERLVVALNGFKGQMGSVNVNNVGAAIVDNAFDDYEPETRRVRVLVDVRFWHEEATA